MQKILNGKVIDLTEREIAQGQAFADDYNKKILPNMVRNQRNRLLSDTDWMALSDNTMTPEWASYRQALRDITEQTGFPYSVIWPTKP
jgi:hypothetical protein